MHKIGKNFGLSVDVGRIFVVDYNILVHHNVDNVRDIDYDDNN